MHAEQRRTEAVNLRMSPRVKYLLKEAAAAEHRTLSNLIEVLVLEHCERKGITYAPDAVSSCVAP